MPRELDEGTPSRGVSAKSRRCLYFTQQLGHRHSSSMAPSLAVRRVSRHPCWALMSVCSVSVSGDQTLQSLH